MKEREGGRECVSHTFSCPCVCVCVCRRCCMCVCVCVAVVACVPTTLTTHGPSKLEQTPKSHDFVSFAVSQILNALTKLNVILKIILNLILSVE